MMIETRQINLQFEQISLGDPFTRHVQGRACYCNLETGRHQRTLVYIKLTLLLPVVFSLINLFLYISATTK